MARIDRLIISKSRHRMEAWSGTRRVKVYRVAVGRGGAGAKRMEGDNRTPEGSYRVVRRHPSAAFHKFLLLSYPSRRDRAAFERARSDGTIPATARIGGNIGIHGEKKGLRLLPHKWVDWTQGCIAVDNREIDELYASVVDGARVEILP